ncbi:hypothetical protein BpHYR1_054171 [Brachionus plicatilis]|uniref:Uncharacterized protein n=1 Tax=Brachionus plicatilis TaxID=10195 RepID=A0A3M7S1U8_BRAPC|nr:hypothetical protein BpHYR1_054171 [Brachionus plicatilis]
MIDFLKTAKLVFIYLEYRKLIEAQLSQPQSIKYFQVENKINSNATQLVLKTEGKISDQIIIMEKKSDPEFYFFLFQNRINFLFNIENVFNSEENLFNY